VSKLIDSLSSLNDESSLKKYDEILLKPLNYLKQRPYSFAPQFMKAFNYWVQIPEEKYKIIEEIGVNAVENWFL
jgi:hypothetical protein